MFFTRNELIEKLQQLKDTEKEGNINHFTGVEHFRLIICIPVSPGTVRRGRGGQW